MWVVVRMRVLQDERGMAVPVILTGAAAVVAIFLSFALAVPALAGLQAQQVIDEMQATARFCAAAARVNTTATTTEAGYINALALKTGQVLLRRPVSGSGWGDASGAVGSQYVTNVSLDSVDIIQPGQPVPGSTGLTARVQGIAIAFTLHVSVLGGLVTSSVSHEVWAFPGTR